MMLFTKIKKNSTLNIIYYIDFFFNFSKLNIQSKLFQQPFSREIEFYNEFFFLKYKVKPIMENVRIGDKIFNQKWTTANNK